MQSTFIPCQIYIVYTILDTHVIYNMNLTFVSGIDSSSVRTIFEYWNEPLSVILIQLKLQECLVCEAQPTWKYFAIDHLS